MSQCISYNSHYSHHITFFTNIASSNNHWKFEIGNKRDYEVTLLSVNGTYMSTSLNVVSNANVF